MLILKLDKINFTVIWEADNSWCMFPLINLQWKKHSTIKGKDTFLVVLVTGNRTVCVSKLGQNRNIRLISLLYWDDAPLS